MTALSCRICTTPSQRRGSEEDVVRVKACLDGERNAWKLARCVRRKVVDFLHSAASPRYERGWLPILLPGSQVQVLHGLPKYTQYSLGNSGARESEDARKSIEAKGLLG